MAKKSYFCEFNLWLKGLTRCSNGKGWWSGEWRAAISHRSGLLWYVRLQGGGASRSGGVRTRLWPAADIWREKIKFQISHLFILVPKFDCFHIKLNFITQKFLKFKNIFKSKLFKFWTPNSQLAYCLASACLPLLHGPCVPRLFRFKTFLYNWLAFCRTSV